MGHNRIYENHNITQFDDGDIRRSPHPYQNTNTTLT